MVLGGESPDQHEDLGADGRSARPVGIAPLEGDQAAVPAKNGAGRVNGQVEVARATFSRPRTGRDQAMHPQSWRQEPDQRGEDRVVGPVQPGPGDWCGRTAISRRSTSSSAFLEPPSD